MEYSPSASAGTRPVVDLLDTPPRRVVLFKAGQLGDMLVAVPGIRALRQGLPEAEIHLIGLPWAAELARRFPAYLGGFLPFPGFPGVDGTPFKPNLLPAFLADVQARKFDLAVQVHGGGGYSNPFTMLLGARSTVGFATDRDTSGIDFSLPYVEDRHEVRRYLDIAEFITGLRGQADLEFPVLPEDLAELARLGLGRGFGPYLAVHPGSRVRSRRWSPDRLAEAADALADRYGLRVVVTGGPGEEPLAQRLIEHLRHPAANLAGRTSLGGLAAALAGAALYLGNDTGAAHLANAVGTRTVVVFGSANVANWGALDATRHRSLFAPLPCRPKYCARCPYDYWCLRSIEVDEVLVAAYELLDAADLSPKVPEPLQPPIGTKAA